MYSKIAAKNAAIATSDANKDRRISSRQAKNEFLAECRDEVRDSTLDVDLQLHSLSVSLSLALKT